MFKKDYVKLGKDNKEYELKIGIRELIKFQDVGIDLGSDKLIDVIKLAVIALQSNKLQAGELFGNSDFVLDKNVETLIDLIEESDTTLDDLSVAINSAIERGVEKKKSKISNAKETKNLQTQK